MLTFLVIAAAQAQSLNAGPYIQQASPSSAWIVWETTGTDLSLVNWGPSSALESSSLGSSKPTSGDNEIHEVELSGLDPDTRYYYRVGTDPLGSATYHFVTPPEPGAEASTTMVAISDMQMDYGNPTKLEEIVDEGIISFMADVFGGDLADALGLVLIPGDLVENGSDYSQWADDFFAQTDDLSRHVPMYPVMGNHERDSDYFLDYFHLPDNGTPGYEEHWWWMDQSNVRIIGLDSNSSYRITEQLDWLETLLSDTCDDPTIDFVFAQLHHPHLSELWVDGEIDFTGDVISLLETFSTDCGKPSIHFFGHTHGYSRGQSQDHRHLWVNVASSGGNLDYWGEYTQRDYEQFTMSLDEYGFVLLEVDAGESPQFMLTRISRGDELAELDNVVRDRITVKRYGTPPETPTAVFPTGTDVNPVCVELKGSPFTDSPGDEHGATQWQLAQTCEDFSEPLHEAWQQHENWFNDIDTQAGIDLSLIHISEPTRPY